MDKPNQLGLRWIVAPQQGIGMVCALLPLGNDHMLRLYVEADAVHLVGPALHQLAAVEERKRLIAEFRRRHQQNQMHHNWYAVLAREIEDGLL
jgi:hypothetical protein